MHLQRAHNVAGEIRWYGTDVVDSRPSGTRKVPASHARCVNFRLDSALELYLVSNRILCCSSLLASIVQLLSAAYQAAVIGLPLNRHYRGC